MATAVLKPPAKDKRLLTELQRQEAVWPNFLRIISFRYSMASNLPSSVTGPGWLAFP